MSLIKKECIMLDIDAKEKKGILRDMVDRLDENGYLCDKELYFCDVLEREKVFPTCIGYGIGIPHGKSFGVIDAGLCIARLKQEITWAEEDRVKVIFLIAVNAGDGSNKHLDILAKLSRLMMHEEFRKVITTGSEQEIYGVISEAMKNFTV